MKKILTLAVFACSIGYVGCKKEDASPAKSTMTAKINGVSFTADAVTVTPYAGYKIITGSKSAGGESITVIDSDTPTIYSMGIYSQNSSRADSSQAFSLTRMSISGSKAESAEFDFTTTDSVVVTDGVYNVHW